MIFKGKAIEISLINKTDSASDDFVKNHPKGKIVHLTRYSNSISQAIGYKSYYLKASENGEIVGVLPLFHIKSLLFGNFLVSQAFGNYGGALTVSEDVLKALYEKAVELAKENSCSSIEFRETELMPFNLYSREDKITMYLDLDTNPETIWKALDPKVRNQVRKAEKSGITIIYGSKEYVDNFYKIYAIRMKQLGTPCFSKKIISYLLEAFPENSKIFLAQYECSCIGAGFTLEYNGFVEIPLAATLFEYNKLCPNYLLYWSIISYYCKSGAKIFDFGRCTVNSSTYQFKKQWETRQVDLKYQYWTIDGRNPNILSPDNPRYRRKVELWKKMPLWLTKFAGPILSRNLI